MNSYILKTLVRNKSKNSRKKITICNRKNKDDPEQHEQKLQQQHNNSGITQEMQHK